MLGFINLEIVKGDDPGTGQKDDPDHAVLERPFWCGRLLLCLCFLSSTRRCLRLCLGEDDRRRCFLGCLCVSILQELRQVIFIDQGKHIYILCRVCMVNDHIKGIVVLCVDRIKIFSV